MTRLVIDPVTRVGGQLRVEADLDAGAISKAWVASTMFRGIEGVLHKRDPREAWMLAQRVCGTCTGVHALASVRAVENALEIRIPRNARLVRNLLTATMHVRDHAMVLYQRALPDWVDIGAAITADPAATWKLASSLSPWPRSSTSHLAEVRNRLAALAASGKAGPFAGWTGHPGYRLTPEQSLLLMSHMLDAFDWQRDFLRVEALLGGKDPHPQTWLVGGVSLAAPWGGPTVSTSQHPQVPPRNAPIALSSEGLDLVASLSATARTFVDQVLVPDTILLVTAYPEYAQLGAGPGNYLSFGEYPLDDEKTPEELLPAGRLMGGKLEASLPVDQTKIVESLVHAWYEPDDPAVTGQNAADVQAPATATTDPAFDATIPLVQLNGDGKYSWTKAARYDGMPMETGPLARVLLGAANGQNDIRVALAAMWDATGLGSTTMPSVLGRMAARAVEAKVIADRLDAWVTELRETLATGDLALANVERWDPSSWPEEAEGVSAGEGPRGSVGHWLTIRNRETGHYQVVDGSTWNGSPRDMLGQPGPLETALKGLPVADPAQPLEVLRVVHSIAPCAACAAHAIGRGGAAHPVEVPR